MGKYIFFYKIYSDKDDVFVCHEYIWDKEKILSPRQESNPWPTRY